MKYWVEINDGKITGAGTAVGINEGQKEISEALYKQLTRLPADYETDENGNIISVTPAPEPDPQPQQPTTEEELAILKQSIAELTYIISIGGM